MDQIKTLEDIRHEFAPVANTNEVHRDRLSKTDKLALYMTSLIGSMPFFYICVFLASLPLFIPSILPSIQYISSGFLQLIFLPLILISQNIQSRHSELRAQHEYETSSKAEKEIESILLHLEKQDELLRDILKKRSNI